MSVTALIIILLILISFIGICVMCSEQDGKWRPENKLIFAAVLLALLSLTMLKARIDPQTDIEPYAPGDTQVDKLLDEVRTDNKTIYFDDEFQILVYKYLLKYTREGKYETKNDPEMDDILRKARDAKVHDKED